MMLTKMYTTMASSPNPYAAPAPKLRHICRTIGGRSSSNDGNDGAAGGEDVAVPVPTSISISSGTSVARAINAAVGNSFP